MDEAPLVEQTIREPHALDAVVSRVVVRTVEEVETHADEILQRLGRAHFVVPTVLGSGPSRELLEPEDRLLEVHEGGVGAADDVSQAVEARVTGMIELLHPAIHDHIAHGCQGPLRFGTDGRAGLGSGRDRGGRTDEKDGYRKDGDQRASQGILRL